MENSIREYIVDRLEEDYAVLEDGELGTKAVRLELLPEGVSEGDVVLLTESGYTIDMDRTRQRRQKIAGMIKRLFGES